MLVWLGLSFSFLESFAYTILHITTHLLVIFTERQPHSLRSADADQ
jgi:hypothetical protein